jgi:hypothetical protein
VAAALFAVTPALAVRPLSPAEIVRRSLAVQNADWKAQPDFNFTQTERDDGGPANTYRVRMILGSRYRELIAVNGQPLAPDQRADQERELRVEIAKRERETPAERARRVTRYDATRKEENVMLRQMAVAFDFHLAGEQSIGGHMTWVFDATPRPGYRPPNQRAKVLTGMRGRLWVAKDGYHWAKVEADVVNPVTFEGFLARVDPGTRFEMENTRVAPGVWLTSHFSMNVTARILGLIPHDSQETDAFRDYRPAGPTLASR